MNKEIINEELAKAAVEFHMSVFVHAITEALKDFVKPLDPSEGEEEMKYIRSVMEAVDNVVLTTLMMKGDAEAEAKVKESTDKMLQNLIDMHNADRTSH